MADDPKIIRVYTEGHEDRVVLQSLQKAGLLANEDLLEVVKQDRRGGAPGILDELAVFVRIRGTRSIVLRDRDDLGDEQLAQWLHQGLKRELRDRQVDIVRDTPLPVVRVDRESRVVLVSVGLPGDTSLASWQLDGWAMDDYLLRLSCDRTVYERVSELGELPFELAMRKLHEVRELMQQNGVAITRTKRLLQLLWGITGFRASPAAMAERLVEAALASLGPGLAERMQPLLADMRQAVDVLSD